MLEVMHKERLIDKLPCRILPGEVEREQMARDVVVNECRPVLN